MGCKKTVVQNWFVSYEELVRRLMIANSPSHLWNCDETESILPLPVRKRMEAAGIRRKPPSSLLTGDEHFEFIQTKKVPRTKASKAKEQEKKKVATKKSQNKKPLGSQAKKKKKCCLCHGVYGDSSCSKATEDWLKCVQCSSWFHESCAQDSGIIDDNDEFTCGPCYGD